MKRIVVLISGRGSNMQALLAAGIPLAAVISNRTDADGLAIARDLTTAMGGRIQVRSERGRGTVFSVSFPLA